MCTRICFSLFRIYNHFRHTNNLNSLEVPEQLNIKAVTGACKLIDGCSLELCLATPSVALSGICQRNKVNSMTLSRWPRHEIGISYITSLEKLISFLFKQ